VELLARPSENSARLRDDRFIPQVLLVRTEYENRLRDQRNRSLAVAGLAGLSLLLATVGIFSVVSYSVTLRRKEIGIRLSLGADRSSIARFVLIREFMRPVCIAIIVGLGSGMLVGKAIIGSPGDSSLVMDAVLLASLALIVLVTVAAASLIPVLRSVRLDLSQTLRCE
jgi:ABC-type antimicrobial peptide transport system permease subunit